MNTLPHASGIYKIICLANGRIYIGSAVDLYARWRKHVSALRSNIHHNPHLQNAWNKYKEPAFRYEIIEFCERATLLIREQYYLDTLAPFAPSGFNIALGARSAMLGRTHSAEAKLKQGAARKGKKPAPMSEDGRLNLIAAHTGKTHSPETKAKIARANSGKTQSPEAREKNRISNTGRKLSKEHISAIISAHTGAKRSPETCANIAASISMQWVVTSPNGDEYRIINLAKFCREHGLDRGNMQKVATGEYTHHRGWKCRRD